MSHSIDEYYSVYDEQFPRARCEHTCDACKETIPGGVRYARVFIVFNGGIEHVKRCLRCQKIHEHLRDLGGGEMWPDERLNCGQEYEDHWGTSPPEEIASLAFCGPADVAETSNLARFDRNREARNVVRKMNRTRARIENDVEEGRVLG